MDEEIEEIEEIDKREQSAKEKLTHLEKQLDENVLYTYDPACVRKKSNWSKTSNTFKFDDPSFQPQMMLKNLPNYSPKLNALLKNIEKLDKQDLKEQGKLYKHFIFSDLKFGNYGAKMLASAFVAKGYKLGYSASLKKGNKINVTNETEGEEEDDDEENEKKEKKRYQKI